MIHAETISAHILSLSRMPEQEKTNSATIDGFWRTLYVALSENECFLVSSPVARDSYYRSGICAVVHKYAVPSLRLAGE